MHVLPSGAPAHLLSGDIVAEEYDVHATWFPVIGKALAYLCLERAQNREPEKFDSVLKRVKFIKGLGLRRDHAAEVAGSSAKSVRVLRRRAKSRKAKRNVAPFRRTAVTFDPPAGSDIRTWPMTFDAAETFYFKPEAGRIMASPVDMKPSEPCDAQADELETAIAIDRIHTFTTMEVRAISHKWGGLRTFRARS